MTQRRFLKESHFQSKCNNIIDLLVSDTRAWQVGYRDLDEVAAGY
jgi:hypothetical protein